MQAVSQTSSISYIYKSRKTLLELLKKQGYNTDEYSNFSINEVNSMKINNQLDMLLEKPADEEFSKPRKIYVRYVLQKTLRPQNIQDMIDDLYHLEEILTKDDTLMIISKEEMNETIMNLVKQIWDTDGIFIIIQSIPRLQYNLLEHSLVPPHRILSQKELVQIKVKYNIMNDGQFPERSRFDPVAKAIGIRPGQVCEIIRSSKTSIVSTYYRICI
jgi:DNA-directed RNA polymerase subunit H